MSPRWLKKILPRSKSTHSKEHGASPAGSNYAEARRNYQTRRRKELRDRSRPPFMPLERPLRSQSADGSWMSSSMSEQTQSKFMQEPAEVRLAIYAELLAERTVHLWYGFWPGNWRGGRISMKSGKTLLKTRRRTDLPDQWNFYHSVCTGGGHYAPVAKHWHWVWSRHRAHSKCAYGPARHISEPYNTETLLVMPFLLTCKKMYSEIINMMYSKLTFSLRMSDWPRGIPTDISDALLTPPIFSQLLLSDNFQRITSLDLEWTLITSEQHRDGLFFDPAQYKEWWDIILSMRRLQKLCLLLSMEIPPSPITDYCCKVMNEPIEMMKNKNLSEFHIAAPEPFFRIFRKIENPPCTFSFLNYQTIWGQFRADGTGSIFQQGKPPYDDGAWKRSEHDGIYFPMCGE
ncbi:hypothetical protein BT63DRAFT_423750 [Microthyrium microscopicum]|uniref:DUF7730 domain-containing protein n=1 Tax=Microthyrium microscopicum TaxID=703497 RepID=A0A6A6UDY4_9PEZI|nr:hypothetical protein BT63DRAFT_423750 [Microthyrium microscopicum]